MRILILFTFLTLLGCSAEKNKLDVQTDSTKATTIVDTTTEDNESQVAYRKEYIEAYHNPIIIDTFLSMTKKGLECYFIITVRWITE